MQASDGLQLPLTLLIAVLGIVVCFYGQHVFKLGLGLTGFLVGRAYFPALLVGLFGVSLRGEGSWFLATLVGGVFGAAIAVALNRIAVPLLGAGAGALIVLVSAGGDPAPGMVLLLALIAGVSAFFAQRLVIIVSTSFAGAFALAHAAGDLSASAWSAQGELAWLHQALLWLGSATWIALGVAGVVTQYRYGAYRAVAANGVGLRQAERTSTESSAGETVDDERLEAVLERAETDKTQAERDVKSKVEKLRREAHERFAEGLEALRSEVDETIRSSGAGLAPWWVVSWSDPAEATITADTVAETPIRLGTVDLFANESHEDILSLPAAVAPARAGAVVITTGAADPAKARAAFVGWCVRLIIVSGPGRVAVAWFDEGSDALDLPAAWRPCDGASGDLASYYRIQLWRRMNQRAADAESTAGTTDVRLVVVAIGEAAERVRNLERMISDYASAGAELGVHLLVATRWSLDVEHEAVLHIRTADGGSSFWAPETDLGEHEVTLQEPPPDELVERIIPWSAPLPGLADAEQPTAASSSTSPLQAEDDDAALLAPSDDIRPATTGMEDGVSVGPPRTDTPRHHEAGVVRLRELLAAPNSLRPSVTLGVDDRDSPVRVVFDRTVILCGGSVSDAAARLSSYLIEVACQASADAMEFAVLDLSDEAVVADRFDAILDLVPHLVDFANGVQVYVTLEDAAARIDAGAGDGPRLCLFVVAPHGDRDDLELPAPLVRVMSDGPTAGVVACVWLPDNAADLRVDRPDETLVMIVPDGALLQVDGQPAIPIDLAPPLTITDTEAVAATLREVRA